MVLVKHQTMLWMHVSVEYLKWYADVLGPFVHQLLTEKCLPQNNHLKIWECRRITNISFERKNNKSLVKQYHYILVTFPLLFHNRTGKIIGFALQYTVRPFAVECRTQHTKNISNETHCPRFALLIPLNWCDHHIQDNDFLNKVCKKQNRKS